MMIITVTISFTWKEINTELLVITRNSSIEYNNYFNNNLIIIVESLVLLHVLLVSYGIETQCMRDLSKNKIIRALYVVREHGYENMGMRMWVREHERVSMKL